MKVIIALLFVAAFAAAQQGRSDYRNVVVKTYNFENSGLGPYSYNLELDNGVKVSEQGQLKKIGTEEPVVAQGSFSFVAEDGQTYTVTWIADENGYQPSGAHLPRNN